MTKSHSLEQAPELLQTLADKHQLDLILDSRSRGNSLDRPPGEVIKGLSMADRVVIRELKSDDIKDKGLRRPLKPVKRKRSTCYKLS